MTALADKLASMTTSFPHFLPEAWLALGILLLVLSGLLTTNKSFLAFLCATFFSTSLLLVILNWPAQTSTSLFNDMLIADGFSSFLKVIFDVSGLITVWMTWRNESMTRRLSEYFGLVLAVVLGAHLLVMSVNFTMVFISLEMISLSSYVLAGFSFSKKGAEGSFKYFLFGSVASAIMLYGFTMIYGLTGQLNFASDEFAATLMPSTSGLMFVSSLMALTGFFYKISAAPFHPWAPDVYEAAPMPVVAFFSVVPKLAGLGVLTRFTIVMGNVKQPLYDWQNVIAIVAMLSIAVGNLSALWQTKPKRLMAYSSIAQSGFLLVGLASFMQQGFQFMLFYATVYMIVNFLVFLYLQYFESLGFTTLETFSGIGKRAIIPSVFLLVGLIALTGLPPTAGFTSKLFVFTALWESYELTGKSLLLWLLVFGLLNTVVALFYYIRIPYYAFIKGSSVKFKANIFDPENFFGLLLVVLILILFFNPGLLMGWINKINFVL
jgi:NADH-quinone oxidoreductase subunit N